MDDICEQVGKLWERMSDEERGHLLWQMKDLVEEEQMTKQIFKFSPKNYKRYWINRGAMHLESEF
jgi:hypothetical protein